jgi:hypothetical protein
MDGVLCHLFPCHRRSSNLNLLHVRRSARLLPKATQGHARPAAAVRCTTHGQLLKTTGQPALNRRFCIAACWPAKQPPGPAVMLTCPSGSSTCCTSMPAKASISCSSDTYGHNKRETRKRKHSTAGQDAGQHTQHPCHPAHMLCPSILIQLQCIALPHAL